MSDGLTVVIGATGNIGAGLTCLLLAKGRKVRAVGRSADKLKALKGAEPFVADLEDKASTAKAFAGASAAFLMIPPKYDSADFRAYQNKVGESLAEAVKSSGVKHVVHLSSVGAHLDKGNGPIAGLYDNEKRLNALSANVVHLRPAYFMENHLGSAGLVKHKGINGSGLKGDVPMAMIATKDIAAAAAELLSSPSFTGKSVKYLLGAKDYTMAEATRILGAAVGKKDLSYVQFPAADLQKALTGMGFSADLARLFAEMAEGFSSGRVKPTESRGPKNTTPTTLEQFAPVFAAVFEKS